MARARGVLFLAASAAAIKLVFLEWALLPLAGSTAVISSSWVTT
jgi:hypothetical protein